MKTIFTKEADTKKDWYVIDAKGKTLGKVAVKAAVVLRGKHKRDFAPNTDCGDYVVIINASKVTVSGNKGEGMLYRKYSGYVGGLKSHSFNDLIARHPEEPLRRTVWGMLPHGRLGRQIFKNLKVYAGDEHPHTAQNPKSLEV